MKKYIFLMILFFIIIMPVQAKAEMLPEGNYYIEVTLTGGTGRAQVGSPVQLTVNEGVATAVIKWSSPYYQYMLIDETYYYPISTAGHSTFEIPVIMDTDMAITAQTIAMSEPHEIDYVLHFDSATLKPGDEEQNISVPGLEPESEKESIAAPSLGSEGEKQNIAAPAFIVGTFFLIILIIAGFFIFRKKVN